HGAITPSGTKKTRKEKDYFGAACVYRNSEQKSQWMSPLLKQLFLPPASVILLLFAALLLTRKRGDAGWWISLAAAIFLYALATPLCSNALSRILEIYPPLAIGDAKDAQAIVIPGSDIDYSVERNRETVGVSTLARLRYGAWLHTE